MDFPLNLNRFVIAGCESFFESVDKELSRTTDLINVPSTRDNCQRFTIVNSATGYHRITFFPPCFSFPFFSSAVFALISMVGRFTFIVYEGHAE